MPHTGVLALAELLYHSLHLHIIAWDFPEFDSADEDVLRLALALNASLSECDITLKGQCRFSSNNLMFGNDRNRLRRLLNWPTSRDFDPSLMQQRTQFSHQMARRTLDFVTVICFSQYFVDLFTDCSLFLVLFVMAALMVRDQKCGDRVRIRDGLRWLQYEDDVLIRELTGECGTITSADDESIRAVFGDRDLRFKSSEIESPKKVSTLAIAATTSLCLQVHLRIARTLC